MMMLVLCAGFSLAEEYSATVSNNAGLNGFIQRNPTHVAIFTATFCPDCYNNKATIDNIRDVARQNGFSIVFGDAGTFAEYKDPQNYLRQNSLYRLSGLPSLLYIKNNKIVNSIVNQQIYDRNLISQFLSAIDTRSRK